MKVAIILPGTLPMPPVKGGAVENLINNVVVQNEISKEAELYIFSRYDKSAVEESTEFNNTRFIFFKIPQFINIIDKLVFLFIKYIINKKNSQSYRNVFSRLYYLRMVSKNLKNNFYDKIILENHTSIFLTLKWHNNFKKYSGKYYYHAHNDIPSFYGCKDIMLKSQKIICVSKYIADLYKRKLGNNQSNVAVLRNCVDEKKFSKTLSKKDRDKLLEKYKIPKNDKIILFVGRIVPEKGIMELILSLDKVKNNNYKLLIIGSSLFNSNVKTKFEEEVERKAKELKNKIIFSGYVNYSEMYKLYKLSSFAVLPSTWNDPAPLTIIECLISRLPIITTNSGGIPEYATNGSAIILERDKNLVNNLAKNIERLITDDEMAKKMSKNSIMASEELTMKNFYDNLLKIIKELN